MNSSSNGAPTVAPGVFGQTNGAHQTQGEDLADRDLQASALAAAGMVAESVRMSTSSPSQPTIGLQPPPPLAMGHAPPPPTSTAELDSINWNMMDIGTGAGNHLDDIDMDFAAMFDPANELANMQMEGSGWPSSGAGGGNGAATDGVPSPFGSMAQDNHHG